MKSLRTISTRRLLVILAASLGFAGGATAIGLAVADDAPKPPARALPVAIHNALTAKAPQGITARISFTNKLIDDSSLHGTDPILSGATGRLWWSPGHQFRLELQSENGDAQIVSDGKTFFVYDGSANMVYKGTLPTEDAGTAKKDTAKAREHHGIPTVAKIAERLQRLTKNITLSGAIPSNVGGRPAYTVRVSPRHDAGLLGAAEAAWDATRGLPLRVAVYAQGGSDPVLELKATDISYGPVDPAVYKVSPPANVRTTTIETGRGRMAKLSDHAAAAKARRHGHLPRPATVADVQKQVGFQLTAPKTLVGLPRHDVRVLRIGKRPAALVTYGRNLGGIAVVETAAKPKKAQSQVGGERHGPRVELPTISIDGTTGQELDTALGTLIRFDRGGVSYIVVGSVPPAAAEAAARAL